MMNIFFHFSKTNTIVLNTTTYYFMRSSKATQFSGSLNCLLQNKMSVEHIWVNHKFQNAAALLPALDVVADMEQRIRRLGGAHMALSRNTIARIGRRSRRPAAGTSTLQRASLAAVDEGATAHLAAMSLGTVSFLFIQIQ